MAKKRKRVSKKERLRRQRRGFSVYINDVRAIQKRFNVGYVEARKLRKSSVESIGKPRKKTNRAALIRSLQLRGSVVLFQAEPDTIEIYFNIFDLASDRDRIEQGLKSIPTDQVRLEMDLFFAPAGTTDFNEFEPGEASTTSRNDFEAVRQAYYQRGRDWIADKTGELGKSPRGILGIGRLTAFAM